MENARKFLSKLYMMHGASHRQDVCSEIVLITILKSFVFHLELMDESYPVAQQDILS
jgi:hypothetical protein